MQRTLDLKTYEIPKTLPAAQEMCKDLVGEIDKTHNFYKQQIEYLKQQFKIALRNMRPDFVTPKTLGQLFDEIEMTTEAEIDVEDPQAEPKNPKKQRKKKIKAIPDHLPRTIIEHDLPASDKKCGIDGRELSLIGYDVKEELKYSPAKFTVIEHRFPKYSCKTCREGAKRQPPLPSILPGSYASNELLAHIAVSKFCNHLPLYRQEQIFSREGINISRQVMSDWMIKLGASLNPLIGIMHEKIIESEVIHADETPVKMLTKDGVRTSKLAYMWQLSRWGPRPLIMFEYDATRKKEVAERLLGCFSGYIQIDGYSGYDVLFEDNSPRIRVGCMAHVIRKFKDFLAALPKDKRKGHPAAKIIELIRNLYDIEEMFKLASPEQRLVGRQGSSAKQIFDDLQEIVSTEIISVSSKSPYYAALRYAHGELPHIKNYLKHGSIELDNNLAENAIRPFALGRKNWLFICAERGAVASANIYSILITAKANGIEPYSYLNKVINEIPLCQSVEDFEKLLPVPVDSVKI